MDNMGQIGIALGPTGRGGRVVMRMTQSPAHHVVVGLGGTRVVSATLLGVRLGDEQDFDGGLVWSRFAITPQQAEDVAFWALHRVGAGYAWLLDAAIGFELASRRRLPLRASGRRFQCAQFAGLALAAGGVAGFEAADWTRLMPSSFLSLFRAEGWIA